MENITDKIDIHSTRYIYKKCLLINTIRCSHCLYHSTQTGNFESTQNSFTCFCFEHNSQTASNNHVTDYVFCNYGIGLNCLVRESCLLLAFFSRRRGLKNCVVQSMCTRWTGCESTAERWDEKNDLYSLPLAILLLNTHKGCLTGFGWNWCLISCI